MGKIRITTLRLAIRFVCVALSILVFMPQTTQAAGICGTGTWTSGNLEIHHINIGQGDSALIVGPTGKSLLLDVGETHWNSSSKVQIIGPYIEGVLGCKSLDYVLISHFHLDHIGYVGYGGLWHLVETQGFTVGTTLVRNYANYLGDISGTFTNWKTYLEGAGQAKLHPVTAIEGTSQVDLGVGVTFNIVALDGNGAIIAGNFSADSNPPSENDYSIGAVLSYGNFDEWLGGDLDGQYEVNGFGYTYHDIELSVAPEVDDMDVYKANHHGSSHSSSATFINQLDPEVSILSLGDGNTFGHPPQSTMDRLLATSTVYMTQRGDTSTNIGSAIVAGNIVIKTADGTDYTVNGTHFTATEPTRIDSDNDGYFAEADPNDNNLSLVPSPNGGCGPIYQTCVNACQVTAGQVLINEVLPSPAPSTDPEWVELYNTTASTINIGYCYIDDIIAGSPAYQIPASTLIPPHGFWTLDRITYFNNTGDDVRFLKEDASTVLDSFTLGYTGSNLSWYRLPDGSSWAASPTASITKGQTNTLPFYPIVLSSVLADENPTAEDTINFIVTFSKAVTGVNSSDFTLTISGMTSPSSISAVNGSGTTYTVTVNTGSGDGSIRLNVVDDDSIKDGSNHPLGGTGAGNGNFVSGETYTIDKPPDNAEVFIGGVPKGSYYVGSEETISDRYGINGGPILVSSIDNLPIFTSQRAIYLSSFNSIVGYPGDQLTTDYWFTSYDDKGMSTFLVIGNPDPALTAEVDVYIAGNKMNTSGPIQIAPGQRVFPRYGINAGPVHVVSTNGVNIFTSERTKFKNSFNEVMGYPGDQLATEYWFTSYDDKGMITYLVVGNPHETQTAEVDVYIGGNKMNTSGSIQIAPGQRVFPRYGINAGPVRVVSTNGVEVFASERTRFGETFNEVMGYPGDQVASEFWFTSYDDTSMITYLVVGNPSTSQTAEVDVYIGGVKKNFTPYQIAPGQRMFQRYSVNAGPVRVISTNGVNVFASERSKYLQSFNEILGIADNQLTTDYWFTSYDDVGMTTSLIIGAP